MTFGDSFQTKIQDYLRDNVCRYPDYLKSIELVSQSESSYLFQINKQTTTPFSFDIRNGQQMLDGQRCFIKVLKKNAAGTIMIAKEFNGAPVIGDEPLRVNFADSNWTAYQLADVGVSLKELTNNNHHFDLKAFVCFGRTLFLNLHDIHAKGYIHFNIHAGHVCIKHNCAHIIDYSLTSKAQSIAALPYSEKHIVHCAPECKSDCKSDSTNKCKYSSAFDIYGAGKMLDELLDRGLIDTTPIKLQQIQSLVNRMTCNDPNSRPSAIELFHEIDGLITTKVPVAPLSQLANHKLLEILNSNPKDNVGVLETLGDSSLEYILPRLNFEAAQILRGIELTNTWISDKETTCRELFLKDRKNKMLENPYILLENLFESKAKYEFQALDLSGKNITFFSPTTKEGTKMICDRDQFERQWEHITHGIFSKMDTENIFFAGGAVLGALQPFDESKDLDEQLEQAGYYNSDIDVFVYGIDTAEQATLRAEQFCEEIVMQCKPDIILTRNMHTLTIVRPHPKRHIQLIFRLYHSPAEILMGFDIDSCCVGYDGKNVYGLPRFIRSMTTGYNVVDMSRRSPSYEYRLYKYSKRGFGVLVPGYCRDEIILYPSRLQQKTGIQRLIGFEEGMSVQLNKRNYENMDEDSDEDEDEEKHIGKKMYHIEDDKMIEGEGENGETYFAYQDTTQEIIDLDRITEAHQFEKSNYYCVKVPRGPKWPLARIREYLDGFSSSYVTNYGGIEPFEWEEAQEDPANPFRTEDYENLEDLSYQFLWISDMTEMMFNQKWLLSKYEAWTNSIAPVTVDGSWIIENPGQQMLTGSFQPIESTWDEWLGFVNVHHHKLASWKMAADLQAKRLGDIQSEGRSPPSVYWVPVVDDNIPSNAIPMFTKADGTTVYAGRTYDERRNKYTEMVYDCGIIVGEVLTNKFKYKMENDLETKESKDYEVLVGDPKAVNWYSLPNSTPIVVSNDSIDGKRLVFGGNTIKVSSFIGKGQFRISNESGAIHIDTYLGYFGNQSADQSSNRFRSLADWRLQLDSVQLLVYT